MAEGLLIFYQYPSRFGRRSWSGGPTLLLILLIFSVLRGLLYPPSRQFNAAQRRSGILNIFRHSKSLRRFEIRPESEGHAVGAFLSGYRSSRTKSW